MNFTEMSDAAILDLIGERFRQRRLNQNISQLELARRSGTARRTVQAIEAGESISLGKLLALLRTLDVLDGVDHLIPPVPPSPLQLAKMRGKRRKRAYTVQNKPKDSTEVSW